MSTVPVSESALSKTFPRRQLRPLKYGDDIERSVRGGDRSKYQSSAELGRKRNGRFGAPDLDQQARTARRCRARGAYFGKRPG